MRSIDRPWQSDCKGKKRACTVSVCVLWSTLCCTVRDRRRKAFIHVEPTSAVAIGLQRKETRLYRVGVCTVLYGCATEESIHSCRALYHVCVGVLYIQNPRATPARVYLLRGQ